MKNWDNFIVNINERKLISFIDKTVGIWVNELTKPCSKPNIKVKLLELLHILNISEADLRKKTREVYKNTVAKTWALQNEPFTNLLIYLMSYFMKKRNKIYNKIMYFYIFRFYINLFNKHLKYCNDDVFKYTLNSISSSHLFRREKTIPMALMFLADTLLKKYKNDIQKLDINKIIPFITESRHRVAQSVRSFANAYYINYEKGNTLKNPKETDEEGKSLESREAAGVKGRVFIDKTFEKICVYKEQNSENIEMATKISKIKLADRDLILKKFYSKNNCDHVRDIISIYINKIKKLSVVCTGRFFTEIGKYLNNDKIGVMAKTEKIAINIFTLKKWNNMNKNKKTAIKLFIILYILLYLRKELGC